MGKVKKCLLGAVLLVTLGVSLLTRNSITDHYNTSEARMDFLVPYFPEDGMSLLKGVEKNLEKSSIIIVGKATGNAKYVYRNFIQEVEVVQVLRGEEQIAAQENIKLTGCGCIGYQYASDTKQKEKSGKTYVDTNFLNYMTPGDEYLIFIDRKVNISNDEVYELNKRSVTCQYLNLSRDSYKVCKVENTEDVCDIPYCEVKDSEFATNSENIMKSWIQMKKDLIKKYVSEA